MIIIDHDDNVHDDDDDEEGDDDDDDDDDEGNDMDSCGTRVSQNDHPTWEHPSYMCNSGTLTYFRHTNILIQVHIHTNILQLHLDYSHT